jgi:FKBP-type peptidyl-prolyl cis-trans isomerase
MIISAVALLLVVIAGGLLWRHHSRGEQQATIVKQMVGDHRISLNQPSAKTSSSGLGVSGQADSLGQLGGSNKQSQTSGGGNSSSDSPDPASLAQYEKYQTSPNALMGDIQPGTGAELTLGQKANIYYKVWLTNGTLVDQTPAGANGQRQPFSFTLGGHQVIPGLEQGVAGMKAGGKRLVIVPPAVGYGAQGQGNIPPNAVLVFEVQLVSVQ